MAAFFAARPGVHVVLVESTSDGGRKILVSGGGRCNLLPLLMESSRYATHSSPNSLRKILKAWPLDRQRDFFEGQVGLALTEERFKGRLEGKLFPSSNRAADVRDGLIACARVRGVEFRFDEVVTDVRPAGGRWAVDAGSTRALEADSVVIATGGLSLPGTGSEGFGFDLARRLGLKVHPPEPALTPLLARPSPFSSLAGISLEVSIQASGNGLSASSEGGFLFTHDGYSGPAVLDISHVPAHSIAPGRVPASVTVRWAPLGEKEWTEQLAASGSRTVVQAVREHLPERLAVALIERANVSPIISLAQFRREDRIRLVEHLVRFPLPWTGTAGFEKAEVTSGGVDLGEIDSRTLECRSHPGLHLAGELLDVTGPVGGYNFFWAWLTGRAAGTGAATAAARDR